MKKQNDRSAFTLTPEECRRLIAGARQSSTRDALIVRLLYSQGMRRAEVAALAQSDVRLDLNQVRVLGKGSKLRVIPVMDDLLAAELRDWIRNTRGRWVFVGKTKAGHLSLRSINDIVARAGRKAGIENPNPGMKNVNPHLLRHSIATHLFERGADRKFVQNLLGHTSAETTEIYKNMGIDKMQGVAAAWCGGGSLGGGNRASLEELVRSAGVDELVRLRALIDARLAGRPLDFARGDNKKNSSGVLCLVESGGETRKNSRRVVAASPAFTLIRGGVSTSPNLTNGGAA